jgi:hypothetical protein
MVTPASGTSATGLPAVDPLPSSDALRRASPTVLDAVDVAVLSILPSSNVLQIGGDGIYARKLAARGCRLWALAFSGPAGRSDVWCEALTRGEFQSSDIAGLLGAERVDAVLFVEPLRRAGESGQPAAVAQHIVPFLASGGRVVFADVRASEHAMLRWQLHDAGLRMIEVLPVTGAAAGSRAEKDDARCVVVATKTAAGFHAEVLPTLASVLLERLSASDRECHELREHARSSDSQVARSRDEAGRLRAALEESRAWHRRSADELLKAQDALRSIEADLHRNRQQLDATANELSRCQVQVRFLRDDVVVKDKYLATLREEAALTQQAMNATEAALRDESGQRQRTAEELHAVNRTLEQQLAAHAAVVNRIDELSRLNSELSHTLDATRQELHRVHVAVAATVAQPRYVIADRVNEWVRRLRFVHAPLKRAWVRGSPRLVRRPR